MSNQKDLKFEISQDEANIVIAGLGKLPLEVSIAVVQKLQQQASSQLEPVQESAKKSKPQLLKE